MQIAPPSNYAICVLQFPNEITREVEKQISYLLKTIQQPKILLYTIDHSQLILFISLDQLEQPLRLLEQFCLLFVDKMKERFGIMSITQGFSGVYQDYQRIEKAYREALTVISIKGKFPSEAGGIHSYQSLGIYQYIDVLLEKKKKNSTKIMPCKDFMNMMLVIIVISLKR